MSSSPLDRRTALASLGALGLASLAGAQPAHPTQPPGWKPPEGPKPFPTDPAKPGVLPPLAPTPLGWDPAKNEYVLPPLPFPADALEPHIDAQTMTTHHDKHHDAYVKGLNKAMAGLAAVRDGTADLGLVKHWSRELAFHGSGHVNHTLFWLTMAPPKAGGGGKPGGDLAKAIDRDFGSLERFTTHLKAAANGVEGGGWAWLAHEPMSQRLVILTMEKQQDQTMTGAQPLLGVDVWEHAYYLKYQNRRAEYVDAFMNVIHWRRVEDLFARARALPRTESKPSGDDR
jgi:superoxide dismutase, Fe-Mn family